MGNVAIARYLRRLLMEKVLLEVQQADGVALYLCGAAAAEWFKQQPKTRPGGNSGRFRAAQLKRWKAMQYEREVRERAAWKAKVDALRGKPDASEPMEM